MDILASVYAMILSNSITWNICPESVSLATKNFTKLVILLRELVFSSMQQCQIKKYSSCVFLFFPKNLFLFWVLSSFDRSLDNAWPYLSEGCKYSSEGQYRIYSMIDSVDEAVLSTKLCVKC